MPFKKKPRKASSKTAEAERINTFLPEIVASFKPDSPLKAPADGSTRVGNKGALVLGPEAVVLPVFSRETLAQFRP